MTDTLLHFAPADGFVRWMAAHPGWLIAATLWTAPHHLSVLMKRCA